MSKTTKKESVAQPAEEIATQQIQEVVEQPLVITIGDLKAMSDLLAIAAGRNTFSTIEIGVAGALLEKLNGFIMAIDAQVKAQEAAQETTGE